jgi:hypothetical protein
MDNSDVTTIDDSIFWISPWWIAIIAEYQNIYTFNYENKLFGTTISDSTKIPTRDKEIASIVDRVITEMMSSKWKPDQPRDPGAFDKEVHKRVTRELTGREGWICDIYVENGTNKVLSIGKAPPNGYRNTTQIDIIYVKSGYVLKVGDIIDINKIEEIYDIKTSITGNITPDQRHRLKYIIGYDRDIKVVHTPYRYTIGQGWQANPRFSTTIRVFSALLAIGTVAGTANAIVHSSAYDSELEDIINKSHQIRMESDPIIRKADASLLLAGPIRQYLSHFINDQMILDLAILKAINKIIQED